MEPVEATAGTEDEAEEEEEKDEGVLLYCECDSSWLATVNREERETNIIMWYDALQSVGNVGGRKGEVREEEERAYNL